MQLKNFRLGENFDPYLVNSETSGFPMKHYNKPKKGFKLLNTGW